MPDTAINYKHATMISMISPQIKYIAIHLRVFVHYNVPMIQCMLSYVQPSLEIAGSTLLQVIDRFALNNHDISQPITRLSENNIGWCVCMHVCVSIIIHMCGTP